MRRYDIATNKIPPGPIRKKFPVEEESREVEPERDYEEESDEARTQRNAVRASRFFMLQSPSGTRVLIPITSHNFDIEDDQGSVRIRGVTSEQIRELVNDVRQSRNQARI